LLTNGEETKIYPGVVSNPEPHSEIGKRYITPIEMAWYMLAAVENHSCLNIGITQQLATFLPNGPVLEGQFFLTSSKMRKAFTVLDTPLFVEALKETIAEFAYVKEKGVPKNSFDIENVTYASFPLPTLEQQASIADLTEQFVLCYISNCIFMERATELDQLLDSLEIDQGFKIQKDLLNSLRGHGPGEDYYTSMAALLAIHRRALDKNGTLLPAQVFELALKALQVAVQTNSLRVVAKSSFEWLSTKWAFIWEHQRFLLKCPVFYEKSITQARITSCDSWVDKLIDLLQTILPTMRFQNEYQINRILTDIREAKH
jgi:hypothetical protein